jgi:MFS family permease
MDRLQPEEHQRHLRRAIVAGAVGTAIEWYDFFLYSTITGLVFARLYFPRADPLVGTLEAFGVYAVGFVARPIGAAIFGHYGDRLGRKAALIATLMLMGVATFLVALVPTYTQIGIWGAILLTVLRFVQGIGVGGEWGGSVLLAMEWAQSNRHRGFIASWPQFGVPAGLFLANLAVLGSSALSGPHFVTWGWRIPFLLSLLLVGVGLWVRLGSSRHRCSRGSRPIERFSARRCWMSSGNIPGKLCSRRCVGWPSRRRSTSSRRSCSRTERTRYI